MGFVTDLVVRQTGDEDWVVTADLVYEGNRERFVVPAGASTNFASVPKPCRWLIPMSGRHSKAAVLHDHLWRARPRVCTYAEADGLFRRALHDLDVPLLRRWIMWAAVRWVSLIRTRLREGPGDIGRVLLVSLFPGTFVAAGGFIVLVLLLTFALWEWVAVLFSRALQKVGGVKEARPPAVISHARAKPAPAKPPPISVPPQPKVAHDPMTTQGLPVVKPMVKQ